MAQIIVRLKDRELQRVPVTRLATRIGRDATNDVVIDNDGVSRHHATLRYEAAQGIFVIQDVGSANGVYVRGRRTPDARLADGDEIQIGKFTLVFMEAGGVSPDALAPESPTETQAPLFTVKNPLPTTALRAARPKGPVVARPDSSIKPSSPVATVPDAPTAARVPGTRPLPATTPQPHRQSPPPSPPQMAPLVNNPEEDVAAVRAQMRRRTTLLLTALVGLLGMVIGLLLGRR